MGIKTYVCKLLYTKPQSLGQGLKRIKRYMGAVGEPIQKRGHYREYLTKSGTPVIFRDETLALWIRKGDDAMVKSYRNTLLDNKAGVEFCRDTGIYKNGKWTNKTQRSVCSYEQANNCGFI